MEAGDTVEALRFAMSFAMLLVKQAEARDGNQFFRPI